MWISFRGAGHGGPSFQVSQGSDKDNKTGRKTPKIEKIQKIDLKQKHYAYHCQVCLCKQTTEQLSPLGSYVEILENRQGIIVSHHPDQVQAISARQARNMIILCRHHHLYLGDAISRQNVTDALNKTATDHQMVFSTYRSGKKVKKTVPGKIVTIKVPLTGEEVKCFFTDSHAEYWLNKAPE